MSEIYKYADLGILSTEIRDLEMELAYKEAELKALLPEMLLYATAQFYTEATKIIDISALQTKLIALCNTFKQTKYSYDDVESLDNIKRLAKEIADIRTEFLAEAYTCGTRAKNNKVYEDFIRYQSDVLYLHIILKVWNSMYEDLREKAGLAKYINL
jgi:hypothetical protein